MPELVRGEGSKLPWYLLKIKGPRNSSQPHIVKFAPWDPRLRLWGIKKKRLFAGANMVSYTKVRVSVRVSIF